MFTQPYPRLDVECRANAKLQVVAAFDPMRATGK
jgi:hypothetical protein